MVAGLFHQIVQPCTLTSQHKNAIDFEVEVGIVRCAALVQSNHPDVLLLHLLQRTDEVGNAGDAHMFRRSRGGLGYRCRNGGRPALRQDHPIHTRSVGGAKQRTQVVRIFNAIQRKQKLMLTVLFRGEQIFNCEELTLSNDGQYALMSIRSSKPGQLVARFKRDADARRAAQFDQPFQAFIPALACNTDMVELA